MKKPELQQFKKQLLALRERCHNDVTQLADEAFRKGENGGGESVMPIHMADVGSDAFEQEFTLSLMENEEEVLEQIGHALGRIETGTFGKCEDCNEVIGKERLQAIPYARLCIACARKHEKK